MKTSRLLAPGAMTLWGLVLLGLLAALLPWQAGKVAQRATPQVLAEVARAAQGEGRIESYNRAWLEAHARLNLSWPSLRQPVALDAEIRHGPWLGEDGLGWISMRILWPQEGGVAPFPPDERLEWRLLVDLLGDVHLRLFSLKAGDEQMLGHFRMAADTIHGFRPSGDASRPNAVPYSVVRGSGELIGETRLPGVLVRHARGDLRLAEMNLRARLAASAGPLEGVIGLDARRAGLGQGEGAWLVEQPRLDLTLGARKRLALNWESARGAHSFGRLDMALRWHGVDGPALRASIDRRAFRLNDPRRLRRQLDRMGVALGDGEIVLERFELAQPEGRMQLEGLLRGRDAPTGLRRLHLDLRVGLDRPLALRLLRASRWVEDEAGAARLLRTLQEQHILDGEDWLRGAASLWDGALTLSGRPMDLDEVLEAPLSSNSAGIN